MKRLRQGQRVKIADPVALCARFYDANQGFIVGAGGLPIDRDLLDGPAWVFRLADGYKGQRGLIVFGNPDSNRGMWLNIESLQRA